MRSMRITRPVHTSFFLSIHIFLLIWMLFLSGCESKVTRNINKIKKDMTWIEVIDLLGVPDKARTDYNAERGKPMPAKKLFMYKANDKWHRIIFYGGVIGVYSTPDDDENQDFPMKVEIVPDHKGGYRHLLTNPA